MVHGDFFTLVYSLYCCGSISCPPRSPVDTFEALEYVDLDLPLAKHVSQQETRRPRADNDNFVSVGDHED